MQQITAGSRRPISRLLAAIVLGSAICSVVLPTRVVRADPDATTQPAAAAAADPVDFRKLKEVLPDSVGGLKRASANGTKQAMGEMKISQAEGKYGEDGKDSSATITIMDYGAMPGMADGMASWSKMEIDNESDEEYSKTTTINGYHALETYNKTNKNGTVMLLVGSRFIVNIEVTGLPADALKSAGEATKLKELEALAK